MRILIVSGIFPPDSGGPAKYVPAIASALTDRGHSVSVLTLSDTAHPDDSGYPFPIVRIRRDLPRVLRVILTVREIGRLARDADIVYLNGLVLEGVLATRGRLPTAVKVVGDLIWERARNAGVFDLDLDAFQQRQLPLYWRTLRRLQSWYMRQADIVITPSEYLGGIVRRWGVDHERVQVIYNSVRPPTPTERPPEKRFDCITVARLVPWKGVADLIRVAASLRVRLAIVGDGPERNRLDELTKDLNVQHLVTFTGELPQSAVHEMLGAARLFVLNSSYEGLPHVVLEAFAAGLPVVATAVGGTPEVLQDGKHGYLVRPDSVEDLMNAVRRLLNDDALRSDMAAAAQVRAEDFSFDSMVARTEHTLMQLSDGFEGKSAA